MNNQDPVQPFILRDFFFIRCRERYIKIKLHSILFIKARQNYIQFVMKGSCYTLLMTMKEMEKKLPAGLFCRVHRSYIIPIHQVQSFVSNRVYLEDGEIPIGARYMDVLKQRLGITVSEEWQTPKSLTVSLEFAEAS